MSTNYTKLDEYIGMIYSENEKKRDDVINEYYLCFGLTEIRVLDSDRITYGSLINLNSLTMNILFVLFFMIILFQKKSYKGNISFYLNWIILYCLYI